MNKDSSFANYSPYNYLNDKANKEKRKYTKIFIAISFIFLSLTLFCTLIIYSSLFIHETLYYKHFKVKI